MKKIFRNLKFGLMLCAGALVASCSDVDDAMNEIPYARVLTPLNFEATVDASVGTDIQFSWSAVSNADSYILELFEAVPTISDKGEEVFEFPENFGDLTTYDMIEVAKDNVPYTLKNLEVDKSFWARVRGVSEKLDGSHWACLIEPVTTSAVRKGLNPTITERKASSITLKWDNAEDKGDLTSIRCELVVPVEGVTAINKTLEKDEIENCQATFENLDPCTNYKFTLLFGKSGSRGIITAYTRPNIGEVTTVNSAEALYNALNGATGEVKLQLAYNDGALYDLTPYMPTKEGVHEPLVLTCALSLYGESTAEGAKPVLRAAFTTAAGESAIHLEDLVLEGGKELGATVTTGGSMTSAEFINCEYFDFTKGIYSGADGCNVETLSFEGIYAHDINATGSVGGDFIDIRGGNYGTITIKNSTFYACARTFFRFSDKVMTVNDINVANCTFNQVTATTGSSNNAGIFHIRHLNGSNTQATISGSFKMTKCVFLNISNDAEKYSADGKAYWCRLTRNSAENYAPTCEGNIFYNVGHPFAEIVSDNCHSSFFYNLKSLNVIGEEITEKLALNGNGMILEEDPCVNSIAGKMYLKNNSSIAANRVGDPRWWNATMPEVVRATELETVTEDYTWDFTLKTKFDTETIETNTIIDNIRIYAPAEVVMGEGVTFAAAATVNSKGIPTNNALAFKAEGYGSVEVTTTDGGPNSSVVILADGDRHVLLADGAPHKVVLGDLQGENEIYVLAGCPITVLNVTWKSEDITPEITKTALAAPAITLSQSSVVTGTSQAVSASWKAIDHAASYDARFILKGATTAIKEQTVRAGEDLSFSLSADEIAAMQSGIYYFEVTAKPVPSSTKYEASKTSSSMFAIGKEKTLTWDFNTENTDFDTVAAEIGSKQDNIKVNTSYNGLHFLSAGSKFKIENRSEGRRLRTGGKSSLTGDRIWFIAPGAGILTINATN
ncbi:MAG: hypothetical protein K2L09_02920, partial [Alistipes sp.]|nr:hypothetical protein [Alistipes sp.]